MANTPPPRPALQAKFELARMFAICLSGDIGWGGSGTASSAPAVLTVVLVQEPRLMPSVSLSSVQSAVQARYGRRGGDQVYLWRSARGG